MNFIILTDTRQQKEAHILKEFDEHGILHIRTGLPSADYMAVRYTPEKGFYLDYAVLIDTKKNLEELAHNLCNNKEHERVKNEILKAKKLGCDAFYFIIGEDDIKTVDDLKTWKSERTKVKGCTLFKIMQTMTNRYNIKFIICEKKKIGEKIIKLLRSKND